MAMLTPPVLWAQRENEVYFTIDLTDIRNYDCKVDSNRITFTGIAGADGRKYHLDCEFYKEIDAEKSKQHLTSRNFFLRLVKKESGPYWPRMLKQTPKPGWLKVDFNRWKDEDDSDDGVDDNNKQQDFSQMLQNMGGGMPGDFGAGTAGLDDLPDSDDDSDDEKLPDLES